MQISLQLPILKLPSILVPNVSLPSMCYLMNNPFTGGMGPLVCVFCMFCCLLFFDWSGGLHDLWQHGRKSKTSLLQCFGRTPTWGKFWKWVRDVDIASPRLDFEEKRPLHHIGKPLRAPCTVIRARPACGDIGLKALRKYFHQPLGRRRCLSAPLVL